MGVFTGILIAASAFLGRQPISWAEVWSPQQAVSGEVVNLFWQYRVPRVLLGVLAGASLTLGGVVFQALFRNPLAEPYTLGIASGSALGAAIGFLLRAHSAWPGLPRLGLFAWLGALGAMGLVYLMSRLRRAHDVARLLLAGVCVSYMCAAGILLAHLLADRSITNEIVRWTVGSLDAFGWGPPLRILAVLLPVLAIALYFSRALDLLAMGDLLAASRGVAVDRVFWIGFAAVGLLTSAVVAECGPIGFVGLIVPHVARRVVGTRTISLLIGGALLGAFFLTVCDGVGRCWSNFDLPVGLFTKSQARREPTHDLLRDRVEENPLREVRNLLDRQWRVRRANQRGKEAVVDSLQALHKRRWVHVHKPPLADAFAEDGFRGRGNPAVADESFVFQARRREQKRRSRVAEVHAGHREVPNEQIGPYVNEAVEPLQFVAGAVQRVDHLAFEVVDGVHDERLVEVVLVLKELVQGADGQLGGGCDFRHRRAFVPLACEEFERDAHNLGPTLFPVARPPLVRDFVHGLRLHGDWILQHQGPPHVNQVRDFERALSCPRI
ncbi:MAG: iron ABC transporter permease [Planctomycetes bacterium]|nr:iron ABC transporter permease [Planctomycetota bacterium]